MITEIDNQKKIHNLSHPKYRPDIDGLRAIAVLSVVAFHAFPHSLKGGFIGVDIFFVISGFLISTIIYENLIQGNFSFIEFYSRRIKRIYPALITTLIIFFIVGWFSLLANEFSEFGKHIAAGAGFVSNLVLWSESGYFDNAADTKPLLHLWSLGVEEQFYILWPVILWFSWKRKFNLLTITVVIFFLSFLINIALVFNDRTAAFFSPQTRFWELLVGSCLAYLKLFKPTIFDLSPQYRNLISFLGLSLLGVGIFLITEERAFPGWWALLPTVGTALVISGGLESWLNRNILSNKVLVWFGLISFPLYLWHWPILVYQKILMSELPTHQQRYYAIAASVILAWLTFKFIEKPLRFRKSRKITLILFGVMLIVGVSGYVVHNQNGFSNRAANNPIVLNQGDIGHDEFLHYQNDKFNICTPDTIAKQALEWHGLVRCLQSKRGPVDIALVGDSHAEHLFIGLAETLKEKNVAFYIKSALPVASNPEFEGIYQELKRNNNIKILIISAYWFERMKGLPSYTSLYSELHSTIERLGEHFEQIYITDDTPNFSFSPKNCKFMSNSLRVHRCSDAKEFYFNQYKSYISTLKALEDENPKVKVLKTSEIFCTNSYCEMSKNGELLYRDPNHLNINGSKFVASKIMHDYPQIAD